MTPWNKEVQKLLPSTSYKRLSFDLSLLLSFFYFLTTDLFQALAIIYLLTTKFGLPVCKARNLQLNMKVMEIGLYDMLVVSRLELPLLELKMEGLGIIEIS